MNFRTWWLATHPLIMRLTRLWFLPKKWKVILRAIVAGVDAAIEGDQTAFTNVKHPDIKGMPTMDDVA